MPVNGFFEKLMRSGQLTLEDGRVEELGVRMAFLPTYTIAALFEEMYEELGDEAFDMMFRVGKRHGEHIIESVGKENKMSRKQFLNQFADAANALGLGVIEIERDEPDNGIYSFKIEDSPFVEELKDSDVLEDINRPIDELWRGIGHGIAEGIFRAQVESEETHCRFTGDRECRFIFRADE